MAPSHGHPNHAPMETQVAGPSRLQSNADLSCAIKSPIHSFTSSIIPLPDWIQRARLYLSKKDYLECSITVASELIRHLTQVVGAGGRDPQLNTTSSLSALSPPQEPNIDGPSLLIVKEDIVLKNVQVTVGNATEHGMSNNPAAAINYIATSVKIQPAEESTSNLSNVFELPQLSERDVCFALGKIFLDLFSEGGASSILTEFESQSQGGSIRDIRIGGNSPGANGKLAPSESTQGNVCLHDEKDDECDDDDISLPALKRVFLSNTSQTASPSKSMKAKEYLQGLKLPHSVCQLVSDLLESEEGNPYIPDTALTSLEEVEHDLMHMKTYPERFLYDSFSPREALDKTCLFSQMEGKLYGRENELSILMEMATRVSSHDPSYQTKEFLCEAAFLGGSSGNGKSSIIKRIVSYWNYHGWSMVFCKFDRQIPPLSTLLLAFDAFFGKFIANQAGQREPSVQETFDRVSISIMNSINTESFGQLCDLLPSFAQLFPMAMHYATQKNTQDGSFFRREKTLAGFMNDTAQTANTSEGYVGSGRCRLLNLFQILFKAVFAAGHPVLLCVEDLQWSDDFTMDIVVQAAGSISALSEEEFTRGGLMLLSSFRDDEVPTDGFLMNKIKLLEQTANVINLSISELPLQDVHHLLTFKFCLPKRYTRDLAELVYQKTRGSPIFVIEFLRSLVQRNLMTFSVKCRSWTWDDTAIDLQMISEGVVELLRKKLKHLPSDVIEALKIASCFGQINVSIVELLDLGQFIPNLPEALESATKEGILEKAGPVFAFSHDMLQESTYSLIPPDERKQLHKKIGMNLIFHCRDIEKNAEFCTLAINQMNICKGTDGILDQGERALVARLNLAAGKHSMSTKKSNFEKAREYFEAGISLLHADHWAKQYALSLELFECSVTVSFMDGKIDTVSNRLDEILSNAKSFDDTLNSRLLLAKLLASQAKYDDATDGIVETLSSLGISFPKDVTSLVVMNEMNAMIPMLEGITKERILNLPTMTDTRKLQAMKLMDLLLVVSNFSSPMLMHLVSCRMTKSTFASGFCDQYSIPGLVFLAHGLVQYSNNNVWLATRISRIAETLLQESQNSHALRARLAVFIGAVQIYVEPFQSVAAKVLDGYYCASTVGDVDNAMNTGMTFYAGTLFCSADLLKDQKKLCNFLLQVAKRKRIGILYHCMSSFDAYTAFVGNEDSCGINAEIEMKTNKELDQLAKVTQNSFLMHSMTLNQMYVHCYFREYLPCINLAENYQIAPTAKRTFDFFLVFYKGIAALNLARDTKEAKWRTIGQESIESMKQLVRYSTWNFENKLNLLQAELYYLDGRLGMADLAYKASIVSARDHKFMNEEALACELYGLYLIENKKVDDGRKQLHIAHERFKQWGAIKKAADIMDLLNVMPPVPAYCY